MIGFNTNCGNENRMITYNFETEQYRIGCFKGTYDEAVKSINQKYNGQPALDYIEKLDQAKDKEYVEKLCKIAKDDDDWMIRLAVAKFSDKYHEQLKDDKHWMVRVAVAEFSDEE